MKLNYQTLKIAFNFLNHLSFVGYYNNFQIQSKLDITKNSRNGKIGLIIPQVPPPISNANQGILNFRKNLPIFKYREEIINMIERNQIIILTGQTGKICRMSVCKLVY